RLWIERPVDLGEALRELREVVRHGEHEKLFLRCEVPVDERLVDAHGARDLLHRSVLDAALVEERAGRLNDLALALPTRIGARGAAPCPLPVRAAARIASPIRATRSHEPIIPDSPASTQKFSPRG